jgi:hypothetical protein
VGEVSMKEKIGGLDAGFDLNIEKILEHWEARHAVREIIANALDEQILSGTRSPVIQKLPDGSWEVRDFGRGLQPQHLTQAENPEKLSNPSCIGKFGIGLKDALATLNRQGQGVVFESRFGRMRTALAPKHGFEEIQTLHVFVEPAPNPRFEGSRFVLRGLSDPEMRAAQEFFLRFAGDKVLEETKFGAVLEKGPHAARIYVNGVRISEEDRFLFSYDIRSPNEKLRKALNRERSNVGRAAYQDRVKAILLASESDAVARPLAHDLRGYAEGTNHDELSWIDVQTHAVQILSANGKSVFFSAEEMSRNPSSVDEARSSGMEIISVPTSLALRIPELKDVNGNPVRGLKLFTTEVNASFEYDFVDPLSLTATERRVYDRLSEILTVGGGKPLRVREILISSKMRREGS